MNTQTSNSNTIPIIPTILQFNEALNAGDVSTMMRLMTPDCIFENTYPPPDGARFAGQEDIRAFWEDFYKSASAVRLEIEEIFACENRCVMRWVYSWKALKGESGHIRGVDIYTVKDGRISEKLSYVKG